MAKIILAEMTLSQMSLGQKYCRQNDIAENVKQPDQHYLLGVKERSFKKL